MKNIISVFLCLLAVSVVWASHTRMDVLMAGDYLDDIIYIGIYPHHIAAYANNIYGDITEQTHDYGVVITPDTKYGALALWQDPGLTNGLHFGYGIELKRFELGIFGSPVEDHRMIGFGFGRQFFRRRIDLSFRHGEDELVEWSALDLRLKNRTGDYVVVPKYAGYYVHEPTEYYQHRMGLLVQRLVFNDGFVFVGAEYDITRGDLEDEFTTIHAGLEMPISRKVFLLLGVYERISNDFEALEWRIEPGFSVRIKEFAFDFHMNTDTIFKDEEFTFFIFKSLGVELNFGKF